MDLPDNLYGTLPKSLDDLGPIEVGEYFGGNVKSRIHDLQMNNYKRR